MSSPSSYGYCRLCDASVVHPGLDHNYCHRCGWVVDLRWLAEQQAKAENKESQKNKECQKTESIQLKLPIAN